MRRLPGVSAELAAACRAVAAAYYRLPEDQRPEVATWDDLDSEVDRACRSGNRDEALAAIRTWRDRYLRLFREAGLE
jgi:hypothetical protein